VRKEIAATEVSLPRYERLIDAARRLFERYHWLGTPSSRGCTKPCWASSPRAMR
jgi:hypothetical protein